MSTVQETNRYQRAIRAIAQREQVTTYAIIEWLKKHEGVGCSMREASNELQAWRAIHEGDLDRAIKIAALGLLAATSGLTRDGRARVMTRLRQRRAFDWDKLGGSTDEAAEKAAQRLRATIEYLPVHGGWKQILEDWLIEEGKITVENGVMTVLPKEGQS